MFKFLIILFLISSSFLYSNETSLVKPPFRHSMGYNKANSTIAKMVLGRKVSFHRTGGISALKLDSKDDKTTLADDAILTLFGLNNHQIVYNIGLKRIKTYGQKGLGNDDDIFFYPTDISVDRNGNIYLTDTYNYRIFKLYYNGEDDSIYFKAKKGGFGFDSSSFNLPTMIDYDSEGNIYISDTGNNRIVVLDSLLNTIKIIRNISSPGGITVIDEGKGWCATEEKSIMVVSERDKLLKLNLRGDVIKEFFSHNITRFERIDFNYIAYDYYGNIWITDTINSTVHKLDNNLRYIVSFGKEGFGNTQFYKPQGISIYRKFGQVFIAEKTGFQYYWIGVDGWMEGLYPKVVNDSTPGVTISIYTTEQCRVDIEITHKNKIVRKLTKQLRRDIGLNHIIWDLKNEENNLIEEKGKYKIKVSLTPHYSSRDFFSKEFEGEIEKQ